MQEPLNNDKKKSFFCCCRGRVLKNILITGAGSGIGRDTAFALAARGHKVWATTFNEEQAEELQAAAGSKMEVFKLDITDPADRERVLTLPIDVLINNAAIGDSGSLAEVEVDKIRKVFEVNVFACLELTQLALRGMIEREYGTIVFVSSLAGRIPQPFLMPYSMSKFALSAAAVGLRVELDRLGKGVTATVVEPGAIHTGFNQIMYDKKFEKMKDGYFKEHVDKLKAEEDKKLAFLEADTSSIVNKLILAAEASRPNTRYVAPWGQGLIVRLARICGV